MLVQREKIRDPEHFLECLNRAYDANEEGVVLKQEDSKYHPGQREHGGWFKMKPDVSCIYNEIFVQFHSYLFLFFFNSTKTI